MIVQTVTFKSKLSEEQIRRVMEERMPQFRALPGLIQKYYVRGDGPGEFDGVYPWSSHCQLTPKKW